jgi:hypothetical protein
VLKVFYFLLEGPNFKTSGVLETTDQRLDKDTKQNVELTCFVLGVAAPVLKLQRARIKTRVFSYFGEFKTF